MTPDTWHPTPDMWHLTWDTWHVTTDMWHLTCYTWHMTSDTWWGGGVNILSKCQLPSSYSLGTMMIWMFGEKGSLSELFNEWINDKGVCRTALAAPCLATITDKDATVPSCLINSISTKIVRQDRFMDKEELMSSQHQQGVY